MPHRPGRDSGRAGFPRTRFGLGVRLAATVALAAALTCPPSAAGAGASLVLTPAQAVQGQTVQLEVHGQFLSSASATAGGRPVVLFPTALGYRGFLGTSPSTPPGPLVVRVRLRLEGRWQEVRGTVAVRRRTFGVRRLAVPPEFLDPALAAYERRRVAEATSRPWPQPLWDGLFGLPVAGSVSSPYGVLSVYNRRPWGYHLGVDLRAPLGAPVGAAQHGVVVLAERLPLGGHTVIVDHGGGVFTSYLHLAAVVVRVGQRVRKGELLGYVGSTGLSTAPHLHWSVRVNGVLVDPLEWTRRSFLPGR